MNSSLARPNFVVNDGVRRALFEADPESKTGESKRGRQCIREMEDILRAAGRRKR